MRAKIINYSGYRFPNKDTGLLVEGAKITYMECFSFAEDDNNHNFSYGHNAKTVKVSNSVMQNIAHYDLVDLIDKEVELQFATAPGKKDEVLVSITPV